MKNLTFNLKERFCEDNGLSIQVFNEPYFRERLNQYSKLLYKEDILDKYNDFIILIEKDFHNDEGLFLNTIKTFKQTIVNELKNRNCFEVFTTTSALEKTKSNPYELKKKDIFSSTNDRKRLLSIDLNQANFQVLKRYNPELVFNTNNYRDLIEYISKDMNFSEEFISYLSNSKFLRQYIFGKLDSKKQQFLQNNLMNEVVSYLLENKVFNKEDIIYKSHDEIVIDLSNLNIQDTFLIDIKTKLVNTYSINVRFEEFILNHIEKTKFFYKSNLNGEVLELKAVNKLFMPQVLRRVFNEEIQENDKVFLFENRILSKFLNDFDK